MLVVFTLQPKGQAAPRVAGSGTAAKASLKVGAQAVEIDGEEVRFAR